VTHSTGGDGGSDADSRSSPISSNLSRSTADSITVRGLDLADDLMGKIDLGEMAFLELTGRLPAPGESIVFNAMLVSLVEHGLTPNTIAARLTYLGAPEALQASVAAGLLGLGSVFVGSIEGAAHMLQDALPPGMEVSDLGSRAAGIVDDHRERGRLVPGIGHPIHRSVDPRARRLFDLSDEHGVSGRHVELMKLIGEEAGRKSGRPLPVNVTGAVGALASELAIPWQICRGLGLMARSIGLVAHVLEEMTAPIAGEIWRRADEEGQKDT
jgi:citrate synthase